MFKGELVLYKYTYNFIVGNPLTANSVAKDENLVQSTLPTRILVLYKA